jgi:hypothetical protein
VDSDDDMEPIALANTVAPETAMSDMCGETAGERHVPPDPRSAHPASFSNIPSNHQAAGPATNSMAAVSLHSNQNLLVDYLREFKDENDKAICKLSKT